MGGSLTNIMKSVSEISQLIGEIAGSAREQAHTMTQVNATVNDMDQTTQKNAAMIEESTAAGVAMAQDAARLAAMVSKFEIGAEFKKRRARSANTRRSPRSRELKAVRNQA